MGVRLEVKSSGYVNQYQYQVDDTTIQGQSFLTAVD